MNRREFLNLTAGSAVAAAVPMPVVAARATPVAVPHSLNIWATAMARAGNPISQTTLSQALKITPAQAGVVMERLRLAGTIGVPNAAGVARAAIRPDAIPKPVSIKAGFGETAQRAERAMDRLLSGPEPESEATPSADDRAPPEASAEAHSAE